MANINANSAQILSKIADQERIALMKTNEYDGSPGDEYGSSHPNALSDGDDKGKGETNSVGTKTDILNRNANVGFNQFNSGNTYP
jgi:hypothetical protein